MKKIDVFNHIWPKPFHDALIAHVGETTDITRRSEAVPVEELLTLLDQCRIRPVGQRPALFREVE